MATTTTTKTRRAHATYWAYCGNHPAGRDCARRDPHGFGLELIAYMAHRIDRDYDIDGVSLDGATVKYGKRDSSGREVTVAAFRDQWEAARIAHQELLASEGL